MLLLGVKPVVLVYIALNSLSTSSHVPPNLVLGFSFDEFIYIAPIG